MDELMKIEYYTTPSEIDEFKKKAESIYNKDRDINTKEIDLSKFKIIMGILVVEYGVPIGFLFLESRFVQRFEKVNMQLYVIKKARKRRIGVTLLSAMKRGIILFPKYKRITEIVTTTAYILDPGAKKRTISVLTNHGFNKVGTKTNDDDEVLLRFVMVKPEDFYRANNTDKFMNTIYDVDLSKQEAVKFPIVTSYSNNNTFGLVKENTLILRDTTSIDTIIEDSKYNTKLRNMLYSERIRTDKEILNINKSVKNRFPWIKYAYINYEKYNKNNLFIDLGFYNKAFFDNNKMVSDKAVLLYLEFISRYMNDKKLSELGYKNKTVFLSIDSWDNKKDAIWDYTVSINPISVICRLLMKNPNLLIKSWNEYRFVILGKKAYFAIDITSGLTKSEIPKIKLLCQKLLAQSIVIDDEPEKKSSSSIVLDIIDKIETSQGITINNLTGTEKISKAELKEIEDSEENVSSDDIVEKDKNELVDKINQIAQDNSDTDSAIEAMEKEEELKSLIANISDNDTGKVKVSAARQARAIKLSDNYDNLKFKNKTIKDILNEDHSKDELPETELNVDTINDEWKHMKFINFETEYDIDKDILAIFKAFGHMTIPINVLNIDVEDNTTSEDLIDTWTVKCEDLYSNRFTIVLDIPKIKDRRFLRLRGNDKVIQGQLMNLPVTKTFYDTCQIVSNYNKIFVRRFGTSTGKSYPLTNIIMKALEKYDGTGLRIKLANNKNISRKHELPYDYIDLGTVYDEIEYRSNVSKEHGRILFNQDAIKEDLKPDYSKGICIGYYYTNIDGDKERKLIYFNSEKDSTFNSISQLIYSKLIMDDRFREIASEIKPGRRQCYAKASIMSTQIPVIVILGYNEGLTKTLKRSGIEYTIEAKRNNAYHNNLQEFDYVKFKDGYIYFKLSYFSSLLLNGIKECDTENYSLGEIDKKAMWLDFLDIFGGRIKADGLDNFYDLLMGDPMTVDVCKRYGLPTEYADILLYSVQLLADNKYNMHVDITGNRYRNNEIIAGYTYKVLAQAYATYRNILKRTSKGSLSVKREAVIDAILTDPTESDLSINNELGFVEASNAVTSKGLSGLNSDEAYGLDKRTFHSSMFNNIGMSTGFASNVGITRQVTIDPNIEGTRGYIKTDSLDNASITKTFTMTEALTPFGSTRDDPFRTAMTFIQTAKHSLRTKHADPLLITNGADEALPYMTPDTFAFKAKNDGKIIEKTDSYMVIEYIDKTYDFVNLDEKIYKNSDGGFWTSVTLKPKSNLKVGSKVKKSDIVALDPSSYTSEGVGTTDNPSYNIGILCKIAFVNSDDGYEDSTKISEWLSEAAQSDIIKCKEISLDKNTNIYNVIEVGTFVQEGDPLMFVQTSFKEEDANILLKNLTIQDKDHLIAELGRVPIKSSITGIVSDIEILRTAEIEEMSESLQKLVKSYNARINKQKKIVEKYDVIKSKQFPSTQKLEPTGVLKDTRDGVKIKFYIKYEDKAGIGDKFVVQSALKGVVKDIYPKENNPTSSYRPDEPIDIYLTDGAINRRMVASVFPCGAINKLLIELDRQNKEDLGIEWTYLHE